MNIVKQAGSLKIMARYPSLLYIFSVVSHVLRRFFGLHNHLEVPPPSHQASATFVFSVDFVQNVRTVICYAALGCLNQNWKSRDMSPSLA